VLQPDPFSQQFAFAQPRGAIVCSSKCPYSLFPVIMHSECDVITPTIAITVHCFHRVAVFADIMVCWMHNDVNLFSFIIMHYFVPCPVFWGWILIWKARFGIYTRCILHCCMLYIYAKFWNFICLWNGSALLCEFWKSSQFFANKKQIGTLHPKCHIATVIHLFSIHISIFLAHTKVSRAIQKKVWIFFRNNDKINETQAR
jgi:hypothetical protein